jgi:hypothetical protein
MTGGKDAKSGKVVSQGCFSDCMERHRTFPQNNMASPATSSNKMPITEVMSDILRNNREAK